MCRNVETFDHFREGWWSFEAVGTNILTNLREGGCQISENKHFIDNVVTVVLQLQFKLENFKLSRG